MASWGSKTSSTQLTTVSTEQFFSQTPTLQADEFAHVQIIANSSGTTDNLIVAIYPTLDSSSETWDEIPVNEFEINTTSGNDTEVSFTVDGVYKFRVGVRRNGSTDTFTVNMYHRIANTNSGSLVASNNLSDVSNASTARYNLNIRRSIGITVDNSGVVISTGTKGYIECPFAGTIVEWKLIADQSGSIVFDVWKANAAVPTIANTITASAKPTLSSVQRNTNTSLTGWTTSVSESDVFGFNVDSATTVTRATLLIVVRLS